jgi:hypothetical protein
METKLFEVGAILRMATRTVAWRGSDSDVKARSVGYVIHEGEHVVVRDVYTFTNAKPTSHKYLCETLDGRKAWVHDYDLRQAMQRVGWEITFLDATSYAFKVKGINHDTGSWIDQRFSWQVDKIDDGRFWFSSVAHVTEAAHELMLRRGEPTVKRADTEKPIEPQHWTRT